MIVTQIIVAPSKKIAISYDPKTDELVYSTCEMIGLVQLENPDEEESLQQVPCYLICDKTGYFYVPELEYNFLTYTDKEYDLDMEALKPAIEEIKKQYKEAETEVVEVETRGKISTIKRSIKRLDDDKPTN